MKPRFAIEHRVPWSDVDLAKIVYFPRYFSYFEMVEQEWVRTRGYAYERFLEALNIWMPRVSAQANYRAPARLGDLLSVEMYVTALGHASYTFGYDAFRLPERTHLVDGAITIVTVSREAFEPVRVPEKLRSLLAPLMDGSGDGEE